MQTTKVVKPHRSQRARVNSNRGKTSKRLALKCMAYDQRFGTVKMITDIYNRLSTSSGLLPTPVGFIFDRELRGEHELNELIRLSNGKIHFIKRRQYENYLLDIDAILAVINSLEIFKIQSVAADEIEEWISDHGQKYVKGEFQQPYLKNIHWLETVDAAKMLAAMFEKLSEAREVYRKTIHSIALTEWLLENKPDSLSEIADVIRTAIE